MMVLFSFLILIFWDGVDRNFLIGNFDPSKNTDFVVINPEFTTKSEIYMHSKAYEAFKTMYKAAKKDGIQLTIVSAFRSFSYQNNNIWEKKWAAQAKYNQHDTITLYNLLKYSAFPGTSRHHWGTDIDLNSVSDQYFDTPNGKKVYNWLNKNASKYGFCQPYNDKKATNRSGYEPEKWHWSYIPLASRFQKAHISLINENDLKSVKGHEWLKHLNILEKYVSTKGTACN